MEQLRIHGKGLGIILRGLIVGFLVTTVLLLVLAFAMLKLQPDVGKTEIGIMAVYVLSTLAGGWYCGRKTERRKFLRGLLVGVLYFLLLLAISGMEDSAVMPDLTRSFLSLALCAGGGMLGGMLA